MSKREEAARRRAEREAAERRTAENERRRMLLGYLVAGVLAASVVAGLVIIVLSGSDGDDGAGTPENAHINFQLGVADGLEPDGREGIPPPSLESGDLERAADIAGCDLRLDLPDEGTGHFSDLDKDVEYETSPPTSGDHYGAPTEVGSGATADGAYLETPPPPRFVHSLEHGRVEIQYSPTLPEEDQLALKGVFDESPPGMLMFPNKEMPYEVAATAWQQLLGCKEYRGAAALDVLRNFRDIYRGQGPEPVSITTG